MLSFPNLPIAGSVSPHAYSFSVGASLEAHIKSARITPARICTTCFVLPRISPFCRSAPHIADGAYPAGANYASAPACPRHVGGVHQAGASLPLRSRR